MIELHFPALTSYQQEVYDWLGDAYQSQKFAIIKAPRQVGKTRLIIVCLLRMAFSHICTSIVFEPTLGLSRNVYKSIYKALESSGLIKSANAQLLEIEFTNGSSILFRSTEQSSRGLTVTGYLILDELAFLDESEVFTLLPLVSANRAAVIGASTPFTAEGYFYEMFIRGLEPTDTLRTFDWAKHPEISRFLTPEQKELYRQTMSKSAYQTEVESNFLTNEGLLFTNLQECIKDTSIKSGDIVYCGIDFGAGTDEDYTVLSVFNNEGNQVALYRTNHLTPMQQVEWLCGLLMDISSRCTIKTILAEYNSIGSVYIDAMKKKLPKTIQLTNWVTSNKSKQDLVTTFQISLENEMVSILDNPILLNEMKKYQAEINPKTKTVSYNGYKSHDDCVMATMLGYYAYKRHFGKASISFA